MLRRQIVIANRILDPPYDAPAHHFRFDEAGMTDKDCWATLYSIVSRQFRPARKLAVKAINHDDDEVLHVDEPSGTAAR